MDRVSRPVAMAQTSGAGRPCTITNELGHYPSSCLVRIGARPRGCRTCGWGIGSPLWLPEGAPGPEREPPRAGASVRPPAAAHDITRGAPRGPCAVHGNHRAPGADRRIRPSLARPFGSCLNRWPPADSFRTAASPAHQTGPCCAARPPLCRPRASAVRPCSLHPGRFGGRCRRLIEQAAHQRGSRGHPWPKPFGSCLKRRGQFNIMRNCAQVSCPPARPRHPCRGHLRARAIGTMLNCPTRPRLIRGRPPDPQPAPSSLGSGGLCGQPTRGRAAGRRLVPRPRPVSLPPARLPGPMREMSLRASMRLCSASCLAFDPPPTQRVTARGTAAKNRPSSPRARAPHPSAPRGARRSAHPWANSPLPAAVMPARDTLP